MCYDETSAEAKIGRLGEQIVCGILQGWGWTVTRLNGDPPDCPSRELFDFKSTSTWNTRFVEVKTRGKPFEYAWGQYPCFTLDRVQFDTYKHFAADNNCELWIVDIKGRQVLYEYIHRLDIKKIIDGKEFPMTVNTVNGEKVVFHMNQFDPIRNLTDEEVAQFQAIRDESEVEPSDVDESIWAELFAGTDFDPKDLHENPKAELFKLLTQYGQDILHDTIKERLESDSWDLGSALKSGGEFIANCILTELGRTCAEIAERKAAPEVKPAEVPTEVNVFANAMDVFGNATTKTEPAPVKVDEPEPDTDPAQAQFPLVNMPQIGTIKTPLADIAVYQEDDGNTYLKMTTILLSLGYSRCVNLQTSCIGKLFVQFGDLKQVCGTTSNFYVIKFRALLEDILPKLHTNPATRANIMKNIPIVLDILRREYEQKYHSLEQCIQPVTEVMPEVKPEVETQPQATPVNTVKSLIEQLAIATGVSKADFENFKEGLANLILQLRQRNFDREQQRLKELLT